ncbi:hypothetical protein EMPS_02941 [Entomortierella parvispora]|uniref:Mediator of RNA polymerase II transcription subunit 8 n=1 Tax=Entomortierella parvispora TaxID=205924 RepID=A0A9P3H6F5_9FUNG|nr:hypothetical protein EMPS_02941 [Entomortierella parvispora]
MNVFPQSEINIEALENVKTRLFQLQESILFFLRSINPETTPSTVSWTELHSKFNVLIAKYVHLTNILNDPHSSLLQSYTVFPNETPATDQQVQNLSVLLRTKLFPELETEDEERTREGGMMLPEALKNQPQPSSVSDEKKVSVALKLKIAMHDALCKEVDDFFEHERDSVHTRARYESDDEGGSETSLSLGRMRGATKNDDALKVDDFSKLSQIRYMSDWGGALRDIEGQDSMVAATALLPSASAINDLYRDDPGQQNDADYIEEQERELVYFDELRRRLQAQPELDDSAENHTNSYMGESMDMENDGYDSVLEDDYNGDELELPLVTAGAMESTEHSDLVRGNLEENEGDDEDEDDGEFMEVSTTPSHNQPDQSSPLTASHETLEGEDSYGDSGEEDMEEVL